MSHLKFSLQGNSLVAHEIQNILRKFPTRLIDEPPELDPPLTSEQKQILHRKAEVLLRSEIELIAAVKDADSWQVSIDRAQQIEKKLQVYIENIFRNSFAKLLNDVSQLNRDETMLQAKLNELSELPEEDRSRQQTRLEEKEKLELKTSEIRENIGKKKEELISQSRSLNDLRIEVRSQDKLVRDATRNQASIDLTDRVRRSVIHYREAMKKAWQQEIENAVNKRFAELMQSHVV